MEKTVALRLAGIDLEVILNYEPSKPTPKLNSQNYDNTLADSGEPAKIDVKYIIIDGNYVHFNKEEFMDEMEERILEKLQ